MPTHRHAGFLSGAGLTIVVLLSSACSSGPTAVPETPMEIPATVREWRERLSGLEQRVVAARERDVQHKTNKTLQDLEDASRGSLIEGYTLLREYRKRHETNLESDVLGVISASLDRLANWFIDVAEQYAHRGNPATASALASEFINRYTDIPLLSATLRAETLLFETRYRRDF
jgi:hypothetical protein